MLAPLSQFIWFYLIFQVIKNKYIYIFKFFYKLNTWTTRARLNFKVSWKVSKVSTAQAWFIYKQSDLEHNF